MGGSREVWTSLLTSQTQIGASVIKLACYPADIRAFGHADAIFLHQVEYWLTIANGGTNWKVVKRDGHRWVVMPQAELFDQVCLTPKQGATVVSRLKKAGVLISETHLHEGRTRAFLRIDQSTRDALTACHKTKEGN